MTTGPACVTPEHLARRCAGWMRRRAARRARRVGEARAERDRYGEAAGVAECDAELARPPHAGAPA
jgi:hypothetical protein